MNLILYDGPYRNRLLPFTYTRPVAEIRIGIERIRGKWEAEMGVAASHLTEKYLQVKYPLVLEEEDNFIVNACLLPNRDIVQEIRSMDINTKLMEGEVLIAARVSSALLEETMALGNRLEKIDVPAFKSQYEATLIKHWTDIFSLNAKAMEQDFARLTAGRDSRGVGDGNRLLGDNIFIEEGAQINSAVLNSDTGPIYIGKNAIIMEGALIRGPFALCHNSIVKMGAKIYGPTTVGPFSKVGGEVTNCVIFGYSNKAHDGFIGNSVIGEWCNLGADTNTSNLKNNYTRVKVWDFEAGSFCDSGLQFCGMVMGDHSKTGINTMLNTGTVIGVSANIFGGGYPRTFLPSFSWGGREGLSEFRYEKAMEVAEAVMERRSVNLTDADRRILERVFRETAGQRKK